MPTPRVSADPAKRHSSTRYRGISYRVRRDGTRAYAVYFRGTYQAVEGGESEARALQADLRLKASRGEQPTVTSKAMFA
jgi:hypothetical protein